MIKTKKFAEVNGKGMQQIDIQINRWLAKHPDYIVVDVKLSTDFIEEDNQLCCTALVIYREYENV
mgnify:CR=1 FL=1